MQEVQIHFNCKYNIYSWFPCCTIIRNFKIQGVTGCRTWWLIKGWDYNAVVCTGKVKLMQDDAAVKSSLSV